MNGRIIHSMPRGEYDAMRDRVNFSSLKHMGRSPAHYKHALEHPSEDTDARRRGRLVHLAVLEPNVYEAQTAVWDGGRRAGKAWEAFCAANEGKELLTLAEAKTTQDIARAVRAHPVAAKYLERGRSEVTVLWDVEVVPGLVIPCKCRIDWVGESLLLDLKTTKDASPEAFGRQMFTLGTLGQAAMYSDGWHAVTGERPDFALLAVESEAPHVIQPYRIEDLDLARGRAQYRGLLERLALCQATGQWPGYDTKPLPLSIPRWAQSDEVEFDNQQEGETA